MNFLNRLASSNTAGQIHVKGAGACLGTLALATMLAIPAWNGWTTREKMDESIVASVRRAKAIHRQIEARERELAALESQLITRRSGVQTLDHHLLQLSAIARESDVVIDSAEPGAATPEKGSGAGRQTPIVVTVRGSFPNFVRFVNRLHADEPDLVVLTLQVNAAQDNLCVCRVTLSWLSAPTGEAVADAGQGDVR